MSRLGRAYPVQRIYRPYVKKTVTSAVAFDAVGVGWFGSGANAPWSHTSTAGAYVLVFVDGIGITACTYGATSMTLLGSVTDLAGASVALYVFGLSGVSGGAQTVTPSGGSFIGDGNSVSFTGVVSAGTPQTYQSPSTTTFSQAVTCTTGQVIAQSFEDGTNVRMTSSAGGTSRYFNGNSLSIRTATASTTFTATLSSADNGAGIAVVLS